LDELSSPANKIEVRHRQHATITNIKIRIFKLHFISLIP
jgi:hypothetical protein